MEAHSPLLTAPARPGTTTPQTSRPQHPTVALAFWDSGKSISTLSMPWRRVDLMVKVTLRIMDWIAEKAALALEQTGRLTVVMQGNGSIHKRESVWQQ